MLWGIELIKQFCSFQYGKIHNLKYKYNFHWFIHFLCSVPLFTIPIYLCIYKENIFKRIFQSFNGIWTTSSGFFVIIYPGDVFSDPSWFINIHTSIYHTILFVYGSFLLISGVVRYHYKEFLLSLIIFFSMWAVAIILNELTYQILAKKGLIGAVAIGYEVPNFITISHRVPSPLVSQYDVFKLGPIKWSLIFTLIFYPLGMPLLAGVSYTLLGGTRSLIFWIISKFNTKQVKKNVAN
ncbi:hypothetical protein [Mycoplasmopsis caviae]|uniref:TMEM164 family acyltransferase n=1 Tax=Mycoplasmopsis caviae TaxID=55603 RepID=UPI000F7E0F85|nr:hypothetical protein [Mycoplasmopsis caviae]